MKWPRTITSIISCPLDYPHLSFVYLVYLQEKITFCGRAVNVDTLLSPNRNKEEIYYIRKWERDSELCQPSWGKGAK